MDMDREFFDPTISPDNAGPAPATPASHPIRILIVDDQNFVCKMLQYSLASVADFEIAGTANSGSEALSQIEALRPDIALVDIEMPGMNGLDITRTIGDRYPQTKVLMLSSHDDENYIRDSLQAGARGYLLKNTPPEELAHAIRFVQLGYLQLGPGLFEKLEQYPYPVAVSPPQEAILPLAPSIRSLAPQDSALLEPPSHGLDWSVATHETINTLPKLWTRGILYLMLAFTVVVLPWAAFSQVDEVGTAQGRLEPKGNTIRLDAPVAGTVATIQVKEGQAIQRGQPLMELQSDVVNADLQQAQAKLEGLLNRQTQLTAIKADLESSLSTARQQVLALVASQQATIDKVQKQKSAFQESIGLIRNIQAKDKARIAQLSKLSAQGAIARSQVEDAERIAIQNDQQFQKAQTDVQQAEAEVQKQRKEYQRILRDGELSLSDKTKQVKELQSQIIDAQSEAGQTKNLIKSLQYQRQQRVLYAPASGTLFQLLVQHPGAVVQPGQTIAQIAPKDARLVLRARMDNKQTGFLKVGLPAKLKFDAYPFQDYGILPGRVNWISPTSSLPAPMGSPTATPGNTTSNFEVEIELAQPFIEAQGKAIALKAGQTATAEVIIRKRRVIDLFLDPFRKLKKDGLAL
ncbi:response regulator [Altericista sp. CCNU0014]|uniref:response regulator n=1 Tax=Altericista sp. CCNU0014 TaxID=3082949 RepID=UPI003850530C